MGMSGIDFHGAWPEMLRADVEDLILQYDPLADEVPADEASSDKASAATTTAGGSAHDRRLHDRSVNDRQARGRRGQDRAPMKAPAQPYGTGAHETSAPGVRAHRARTGGSAPKPARERLTSPARWIAQYNTDPAGPLYAVGRPGGEEQDRLGPVLATSGEELLDKLRTLLSSAGAQETAKPKVHVGEKVRESKNLQ